MPRSALHVIAFIQPLCRDGRMISMIRKRGSKYYYTIELPSMEGRKRIERVGGSTRKECQMAEAQERVRLGLGQDISSTISVASFAERWLDEYVSELADNTQKSYKGIIEKHVLPVIGRKRMSSVKPMDIQNIINSREGLSYGTIDSIKNTIRSLFHYAVSPCGIIATNPADGVRLPKDRKGKKEAHVFSKKELDAIFSRFDKEHDFYIPIMIMYHTGCRIGEVLALKWEDVDLDHDVIHVHATMTESGVISPIPKTKSSNRYIVFSSKLHTILDERLRQQEELSYMIDRKFPLVCCRNDAKRISTSDMRFFNMWVKEELGDGSMHSFRHTHATMLLEAGESLEMVSKRLGHSSIFMTANTYSHILEKRNRKMIDTLELF